MASSRADSSSLTTPPDSSHGSVLYALDRIDRCNAQAQSTTQLLSQVLDELLDLLKCDLGWLASLDTRHSELWQIDASSHINTPAQPNRPHPQPPSPETVQAIFHQCAAAETAQILPVNSNSSSALEAVSYLAAAIESARPIRHVFILARSAQAPPFSDNDTTLLSVAARHIATTLTLRATQQRLRQSNAQPHEHTGLPPAARLIFDIRDGRIVDANEQAATLLQRRRPALLSMSFQTLSAAPTAENHPGHDGALPLPSAIAQSGDTTIDWLFYNEHGSPIPCEVHIVRNANDTKDERDSEHLITAYLTNQPMQSTPQSMPQQLSQALEQTADAVMITNDRGIIEYVNPAFEIVTGYSPDDVVGKTPAVLKSGKQDTQYYQQLWQTITSGDVFTDVLVNRRKDQTLYYEEKTITPLKNIQGNITHFVSTSRDITERLNTQERLHYLANHDVLTDLPNRTLFIDRLQQATARADRHQQRAAVIILDLDRFKMIIDTLGHDISDRALKTIAERLVDCLRAGDTVARLGGDEFAIIAEEITSVDEVEGIARKLLHTVSRPLHIDTHELYVTACAGISLYPDDGDHQSLIKHADTAMCRGKEQGHNRIQFYSAEMSTRALERLSLETGLRRALNNNEFHLHYQPQFDLRHGKIVGVEALLRWHHPEKGLMQPAEFVPILEETDLIIPVGEWVLATVCQHLAEWQRLGLKPPRMAVNLSSRQLSLSQLETFIFSLIQQHNIDCTLLELEITESLLLTQRRHAVKTLQRFSDMGIRLCIDDFGTGYSSLSYLKQLPVDALKIDRTFIRDVTSNKGDAAIVRAIIAMAKSLGLTVVAEGVETEQQLQFLKREHCDITQGFYFSSPMDKNQLFKLINQVLATHETAQTKP